MEFINQILGLSTQTLTASQMVVRACIVFFISLAFIRIAGVRTLGTQTAFDNLTAVMLGAILGRAVVSAQQPFFGSLAAVLALMLLHRLVAWLTFKSHKLGKIFKGSPILLFSKGEFIELNLKRNRITKEDVQESLHLFLNADEMGEMKEAYLERSGEISIVRSDKKLSTPGNA